jgi:hypothetical protein
MEQACFAGSYNMVTKKTKNRLYKLDCCFYALLIMALVTLPGCIYPAIIYCLLQDYLHLTCC